MKRRKISISESLKENIKYSLSVASISGANYISGDGKRSLFERLLWFIIIIAMMAFATWQGLIVYTHYTERPVIVTADKAYIDWELMFPTVTLCFEELKSEKEIKKVIKKLIQKYNFSEALLSVEYKAFEKYLRELAFKNYTNYEDYKLYATGEKREYLKPEQYMEVLDQVVLTLDFSKAKSGRTKALPLNLPTTDPRPVIRIFTEWGPCMVANPNISIYYTPEYFNSTKPYLEYEPINYTLNIMASMTFKTESRGSTYYYFHAPNEVMDIMDRKGSIASAYFQQWRYEMELVHTSEKVTPLTVKQKNCRMPYESDEEPLRHSPVYSRNLCNFECRIKIALKYCSCTPYYYRRLAQLAYMINTTEECATCPQNCDVAVYRQHELVYGNSFLLTTFEMNIVFPRKMYVRNLVFTKLDLAVQIGGIFGLFLGCSLLSFVEIVYSLSLRLMCGIRNRNKINMNNKLRN